MWEGYKLDELPTEVLGVFKDHLLLWSIAGVPVVPTPPLPVPFSVHSRTDARPHAYTYARTATQVIPRVASQLHGTMANPRGALAYGSVPIGAALPLGHCHGRTRSGRSFRNHGPKGRPLAAAVDAAISDDKAEGERATHDCGSIAGFRALILSIFRFGRS